MRTRNCPAVRSSKVINTGLLPTDSKLNSVVGNNALERRYRLFLLAVFLSYAIFQTILIPVLPLTYDEGVSLQVGYLIKRGYEPYTQIFTLANPLFVWLIGWLGKLGLSPLGFKWFFLWFGLLLLANTSIIARSLLGRRVALATVFLLATTTAFLVEATNVVAVIPAMSVATLSLVFTLRYLVTKQLYWLFLGGAVWSVALFISTSALSIGLVTLLFIILLDSNADGNVTLALSWQIMYKSIGVWLAGVLILLGVGLFLATPNIIFGHIFKDYATIRENLPVNQENNFRLVGQFVSFNFWLFLFAVYGLSRIYGKPNHALWLIFIWGLLSFCWLMLQATLRLVDIAILLPALAIMAGWGFVGVGHRLIHYSHHWQTNYSSRRVLWTGLGFLLLSFYALVGWQQANNFLLRDIDTESKLTQLEQRQEIVQLIHQYTNSDDCVVIDDPALAIAADRLPAPELVGLSREQIIGGLITERELEALVEAYECKAVVFSQRKYTLPLSDFQEWARRYYPHEQKFIRTRIYYR